MQSQSISMPVTKKYRIVDYYELKHEMNEKSMENSGQQKIWICQMKF